MLQVKGQDENLANQSFDCSQRSTYSAYLRAFIKVGVANVKNRHLQNFILTAVIC